ncbi:MAG: hypothetical protein KKB70_04540 [Proteobacteria bacterium]|nr:hypothetical protein [Pseudomonadota bacterium]MBU1612605.1 hypothetical protein [Pseudomonadota bacterium]
MSDSDTNRTINTVVRGIFIGGSLGAIASWFLDYPIERAVGFGMLCGVAATLTLKDRMESRNARKKDE